MFCTSCGTGIQSPLAPCPRCGFSLQGIRSNLVPRKPKRMLGFWGWAGLGLLGLGVLVALIERPGAPPVTKPQQTKETKPGCLELPSPTSDCVALLQRTGFSGSFVRSGWMALHYAYVWWLSSHNRGKEKFDRSVYNSLVGRSLKDARPQARSREERIFLDHVSSALDLLGLYDSYSGLRDSDIDAQKLQAFQKLLGTTPEQFAQTSLHGADQCMVAAISELGLTTLAEEMRDADRVCSENYKLLQDPMSVR